MNPWVYALWGAFGGLSVEAVQFYGAIRGTGKWPWKTEGEPRPLPLFVSVVIRVGVGFGLALAAVETQTSGISWDTRPLTWAFVIELFPKIAEICSGSE